MCIRKRLHTLAVYYYGITLNETTMIEIKNFTYGYGKTGRCVFSDFDFRFEPGCVYGLLGENGVGKSTLLHAMMGLLLPRSGSICFEGVDVCERRHSVL